VTLVPDKRRRFAVRWLVRLLGPLILAVLLLRTDSLAEVARAVSNASLLPLLVALSLNGIAVHTKVERWRRLLLTQGIVYPRKLAWGAFLSSMYLGMITPGRVGDGLRAHYLKSQLGTPYAVGLASVVVDRVCDLMVLGFVALLALVHFGAFRLLPGVAWWLVGASAMLPVALVVTNRFDAPLLRIARRLPAGGGLIANVLLSVRSYSASAFLRAMPNTLLGFAVNCLQGQLLASALGLDLAPLDTSALVVLGSLIGLVPISISGVGLREALYFQLFPMLGHSASSGVVFGLVLFVLIHATLASVGFISWQLAPPDLVPQQAAKPAA
jgi:uncharacterized membrane protein YbhN (UPF0104 family)